MLHYLKCFINVFFIDYRCIDDNISLPGLKIKSSIVNEFLYSCYNKTHPVPDKCIFKFLCPALCDDPSVITLAFGQAALVKDSEVIADTSFSDGVSALVHLIGNKPGSNRLLVFMEYSQYLVEFCQSRLGLCRSNPLHHTTTICHQSLGSCCEPRGLRTVL